MQTYASNALNIAKHFLMALSCELCVRYTTMQHCILLGGICPGQLLQLDGRNTSVLGVPHGAMSCGALGTDRSS